MREFRIPAAFTLFGHRITVEWSDTLVDDSDCVGVARLRKNKIVIQRGDTGSISRPRSQTEQTFFHELVHWVLHLLGEEELDKDEKLVDKVGLLLHQAFVTAEYADEQRAVDFSRVMGG